MKAMYLMLAFVKMTNYNGIVDSCNIVKILPTMQPTKQPTMEPIDLAETYQKNTCYIGVYHQIAQTWYGASYFCENIFNTTLASIHNDTQQNYAYVSVKYFADKYSAISETDFEFGWIGFNHIENEGQFVCSDGTNSDFNLLRRSFWLAPYLYATWVSQQILTEQFNNFVNLSMKLIVHYVLKNV